MFPILFKINNFYFSSLGIAVGLGFFVAFFLIWRRLKEINLEEEAAVDLFLFASLAALVFSRLGYVLFNLTEFRFEIVKWLFFHRYPGFSLWGAVLGFFWGLRLYSRREKWNFFKIADEVTFGLLPFLILAQLGMFLDGSNQGAETGLFWGMFFPGDPVRRHPVSLFALAAFLLIWVYFMKIDRLWRSWEWYKSQKDGFLFYLFLILSSLVVFLLAFLKPAGLYFSLLEKLVSGLVLGLSLILLYRRSGRKVREDWQVSRKSLTGFFEKLKRRNEKSED
jgi:phosphatidylglycerol:prolipoprotein diacylglycerol transferase